MTSLVLKKQTKKQTSEAHLSTPLWQNTRYAMER